MSCTNKLAPFAAVMQVADVTLTITLPGVPALPLRVTLPAPTCGELADVAPV